MSAEQATPRVSAPRVRPRPSSTPAPARPRLRLVRPPAQARTHVPFVVTCMAILAAALLAALLLNTQLAAGSYATRSLDLRLADLARSEQSLSAELDANKAPARLAERAAELGMEPAGSTAWLRLSDGTVQGATGAGE
ncbi:hypothetical protein CHO01_06060 [Cellulomonas hominis]|jgi:hypothetical protein|uniref:Cell division protein FtsL n=1 Tax=Cellulomonas hominis TaxID=156981 RepID=A0A511F8D4_9CELL|nr:hypothetical protein [Cellulomonas hominis]MBB5474423.1 hypothetical protein [Cellulomonas hominis]GEL45490.1 hypothetical protein CHO01_06060 [Cellulomonas hominis]